MTGGSSPTKFSCWVDSNLESGSRVNRPWETRFRCRLGLNPIAWGAFPGLITKTENTGPVYSRRAESNRNSAPGRQALAVNRPWETRSRCRLRMKPNSRRAFPGLITKTENTGLAYSRRAESNSNFAPEGQAWATVPRWAIPQAFPPKGTQRPGRNPPGTALKCTSHITVLYHIQCDVQTCKQVMTHLYSS